MAAGDSSAPALGTPPRLHSLCRRGAGAKGCLGRYPHDGLARTAALSPDCGAEAVRCSHQIPDALLPDAFSDGPRAAVLSVCPDVLCLSVCVRNHEKSPSSSPKSRPITFWDFCQACDALWDTLGNFGETRGS